MSVRPLYIVSSNPYRIQEVQTLLAYAGLEVIPVLRKIDELQTQDPYRLLRDKAIKAYQQLGRPLLVEHAGLYLRHMNGLPGALTQMIWDTLQAQRFVELFGQSADPHAMAHSLVGYVDGRCIHHFESRIEGRIAHTPRGPHQYQWDTVFVPTNFVPTNNEQTDGQTLAELKEQDPALALRACALDGLVAFFKQEEQGQKDRWADT